MDFLRKEFEGLPDDIVQVCLKQLESAIRDATIQCTSEYDLHCMRVCGNIKGVIDFARQLGRQLRDNQNDLAK